jgi:hypothetical protein
LALSAGLILTISFIVKSTGSTQTSNADWHTVGHHGEPSTSHRKKKHSRLAHTSTTKHHERRNYQGGQEERADTTAAAGRALLAQAQAHLPAAATLASGQNSD